MASPIQEFFVALGFKVDQEGMRKFQTTLEETHKQVKAFVVTLSGLAVAMEEATRRTAAQFQDLFFLSQQTGVAASQLKAASFAITQIGLSAGANATAMASLTRTILDNPAMKLYLTQLSGQQYQNPAQMMDAVTVRYKQLLDMGEAGAQALANLRTQLRVAEIDPDFVHRRAQYADFYNAARAADLANQRLYHLNAEKAAADSKVFYTALGGLWDRAQNATQSLISKTIPAFSIAFDELSNWLGSPEVVDKINSWAQWLDNWVTSGQAKKDIHRWFGDIEQFADQIGEYIDSWGKSLRSDVLPVVEILHNHFKEIAILIGGMWAAGKLARMAEILGIGRAGAAAAGAGAGAAGAGTAAAVGMGIGGTVGIVTVVAATLQYLKTSGIVGGDWGKMGQGVWNPAWGPEPADWQGAHAGRANDPSNPDFIDRLKDWLWSKVPHFQGGGIVDATLHEGEMVLPANISSGLQSFFSGGVSGGIGDTMRKMYESLLAWFTGGGSYVPVVALSDQTLWDMGFDPATVAANRAKATGRPAPGVPGSTGGGGGETGSPAPGAGREVPLPTNVFEAISQAEGTWHHGRIDYNEILGGVGGIFGTPPKPISEMTLAEVNEWQQKMLASPRNRWHSSAVGAFQVVRQTLLRARQALGLKDSEIFNAALQQRIASYIWQTEHSGAWEGFKTHEDLRRKAIEFARSGGTQTAATTASGGMIGAIQAVIGDSIGVGIASAYGLKGAAVDAIGGTTPKQIYERMMKHIKDFTGENVVLASGSNDPSQLEYVKMSLKALHDVGAKVVLMGVGQGIRNYAKVNQQLGEYARSFGDTFTGTLEGTTRHGIGVVHPYSYQLTRGQIERTVHHTHTFNSTVNVHGADNVQATARAVVDLQNRQYTQGAARYVGSQLA